MCDKGQILTFCEIQTSYHYISKDNIRINAYI